MCFLGRKLFVPTHHFSFTIWTITHWMEPIWVCHTVEVQCKHLWGNEIQRLIINVYSRFMDNLWPTYSLRSHSGSLRWSIWSSSSYEFKYGRHSYWFDCSCRRPSHWRFPAGGINQFIWQRVSHILAISQLKNNLDSLGYRICSSDTSKRRWYRVRLYLAHDKKKISNVSGRCLDSTQANSYLDIFYSALHLFWLL